MSSLVRKIQRALMPSLKPRQGISPQPDRKEKSSITRKDRAPRGRRRGKRSKAWLAFRAARRAA